MIKEDKYYKNPTRNEDIMIAFDDKTKQLLLQAKEFGIKSVTIKGIIFDLGEAPAKLTKAPVEDMRPEDIVVPDPLADLTDEEILYYATPYYDEIQAKKQAKEQAIKEEVR